MALRCRPTVRSCLMRARCVGTLSPPGEAFAKSTFYERLSSASQRPGDMHSQGIGIREHGHVPLLRHHHRRCGALPLRSSFHPQAAPTRQFASSGRAGSTPTRVTAVQAATRLQTDDVSVRKTWAGPVLSISGSGQKEAWVLWAATWQRLIHDRGRKSTNH